jgi:diacylglycerol kinase (ATP)
MHYTIIVNPTSNRGYGLESIPLIKQYLEHRKIDFNIIQTQFPGHAIDLASQATRDSDVIVSAGGDGTANEVINGIMQSTKSGDRRPVMGVLPVGRGNDFAFSMGIPINLEAACNCLADGITRPIDIGIAYGDNFPNGRYFGNGVGVGFDAVVGFEALKMKKLKGFASYIVAALKTIFIYFKAPELEIETDRESIRMNSLMVSIMNGIRMGGGFFMAPMGDPGDNHFDLCCVKAVSKLGTFPLVAKFMKGTQDGDKSVSFLKANKVTIRAIKGSIPAHADGETVCTAGSEIKVELLPHQIQLITVVNLKEEK